MPGAQGNSVSNNVAQLIDEEIRSLIDRNYQRAEAILKENITILHQMADALIKWETIDRWQIDDLMNGKEARSPVEYKAIKDLNNPQSNDNGEDGNRPYHPEKSFA